MRLFSAVVCLHLIVSCASSPAPSPPGPNPALLGENLRFLNPVSSQVKVTRNVYYAGSLRLDIYEPDDAALRPGVLWIHGGGLTSGAKDEGPGAEQTRALAQRGYVCFSIEYRLAAEPLSDWPSAVRNALADVRTATRWIREHAARFRLDPTQLAIGGESAGGTLALTAAFTPSEESVNYFAVLNVFGSSPGAFGAVPYNLESRVPVFTAQGDRDVLTPPRLSSDLQKLLSDHQVPHQIWWMRGEGHNASGRFRDGLTGHMAEFLYRCLAGLDRGPETAADYAPAALGDQADLKALGPWFRVGAGVPRGLIVVPAAEIRLETVPGAHALWKGNLQNRSQRNTLSGAIGPGIEAAGLEPGASMEFLLSAVSPPEVLALYTEQGAVAVPVTLGSRPLAAWTGAVPAIDGILDEWRGPPMVLSQKNQVFLMEDWTGPEDLSARVWTAWDPEALYLAVEVNARGFVQEDQGPAIWKGDSLQFGLDFRAEPTPPASGWHEFGLAWVPALGAELVRWAVPAGLNQGGGGFSYAVRRSGNLTVYEMALPWSRLSPSWRPFAGQAFRFSVLANHVGPSGRRGWIEGGSGIGLAKDAAQFLTLVLEPGTDVPAVRSGL